MIIRLPLNNASWLKKVSLCVCYCLVFFVLPTTMIRTIFICGRPLFRGLLGAQASHFHGPLGQQNVSLSTAPPLESQFQEAKVKSTKLKDDPGNEVKLQLYALYKQATEGVNTTKQPSSFDLVGKFKWNAWTQLGEMSKDDAMKKYIDKVNQLGKEIGFKWWKKDVWDFYRGKLIKRLSK